MNFLRKRIGSQLEIETVPAARRPKANADHGRCDLPYLGEFQVRPGAVVA